MNITMNGDHETKTSEHGTAGVDCIEFGNNDSKLKGGSLAVENLDLDACPLTPKNCSVHCAAVYERSEGHIGKSTCSLTVHETSLPKSEISREGDTKEEKNMNLRPRRKSKYLSPPFIQPVKREVSKGPDDKSVQDSGKPSLMKRGKKRKQPIKPVAVSANLEKIKASSAELISQLNAAACDYLNPRSKKALDCAKLFFTSFRASAFRGVSIEEQTRVDKTYAQKKVRVLKQKKPPSSLCDGDSNVASRSPLKADPLSSNVKPPRKRKRKVEPTTILESDKNQTTQIPDLNYVNGVPRPSVTLDPLQVTGQGEVKNVNEMPSSTLDPLQVTGQGEAKSVPEKKKKIRKKKAGVESVSLEVRLKEAFCASTVPNSNVANPPGFLAKDSTPVKPIVSPKLEPNGGTNSSSGMSLDQMKQSLEFMTSMLEKSGDKISPAMRDNLEKEIKNLLKKVDPMISSSS